jgi:GNAT superfamily N-acetyltransferase
VSAGIQFRTIGPPQVDLLIEMYEQFHPLGAALGLPPCTLEARHGWIQGAMRQIVNVAAFSPEGDAVGHSFLAGDRPGSAEVAVFVRQEFRRRGIGAALLRKALECGRALKLNGVSAVTSSGNKAALRLLMSCGFRLRQTDVDVMELDIDLSGSPAAGFLANQIKH